LQFLQCREYRAAVVVAHHDDEPRPELLRRELDAADLGRRDHVSRDSDDEEVSEALALLAGILPSPAALPVVPVFRDRFGSSVVPLSRAAMGSLGKPQSRLPFLHGDPGPRLQAQLSAALAENPEEVVLDPSEWPRPSEAQLPVSVGVGAAIAAESREAAERGDFQVLLTRINGAPGVQLVECPFPGAAVPGIAALLEDLNRAGVDCPEIRALGSRGSGGHWPSVDPLDARDSWPDRVGVSVQDGGLVLQDLESGHRIVPWSLPESGRRWTGVGILDVLAWIRDHADRAVPRFGWGESEGRIHLPRVRLGRTILRRARWRLPAERIGGLRKTRGADAFRAVQALREEFGIPRWVVLVKNRMVHPLDLENILSIEGMTELLGEIPFLVLEEQWPPPDALLVRGPGGGYVHEMIMPIVVGRTAAGTDPSSAPRR